MYFGIKDLGLGHDPLGWGDFIIGYVKFLLYADLQNDLTYGVLLWDLSHSCPRLWYGKCGRNGDGRALHITMSNIF